MKRLLVGSVLGGTLVLASLTTTACSDDNKSTETPAAAESLTADLEGTNSLINPQDTASDEDLRGKKKNLVELVVNGKEFSTLEALVIQAGLVDTLKNGEFTVFAPTDAAFAKLPKEVVDYLLSDKEALTKVLLYHVTAGSLKAEAVLVTPEIETAAMESVSIQLKGGKPFVNDSQIIKTDILASNGVIHVIDNVLVPPGFKLPEATPEQKPAKGQK